MWCDALSFILELRVSIYPSFTAGNSNLQQLNTRCVVDPSLNCLNSDGDGERSGEETTEHLT